MKRFASLNPVLQKSEEYPFARLLEVKRAREAAGHRVLDFGMGDPRDPTPYWLVSSRHPLALAAALAPHVEPPQTDEATIL